MSMNRLRIRHWILGALLAGLALPLSLGLIDHPDLAVRVRPLRTHAGAIRREAPPGQEFTCSSNELRAIEVALVSLQPIVQEVELVLREESAEGSILRSVRVEPGKLATPEFVAFPFEPIHDSKDRRYHFQLLPASGSKASSYSPWLRFHGQAGRDDPWGGQSLENTSTRNYFQSPLGDLRAIAIGCEYLSTNQAEIRFALWDLDDGGRTRRECSLSKPLVVDRGYLIVGFEPITASKGHNYGYKLESSLPLHFNGRFDRPTLKTFHGLEGETPRLRGATSGERVFGDRDLVFRTWAEYGPVHGAEVGMQRSGWRFPAAVFCWALAALALAKFLFSAGLNRSGLDRPKQKST